MPKLVMSGCERRKSRTSLDVSDMLVTNSRSLKVARRRTQPSVSRLGMPRRVSSSRLVMAARASATASRPARVGRTSSKSNVTLRTWRAIGCSPGEVIVVQKARTWMPRTVTSPEWWKRARWLLMLSTSGTKEYEWGARSLPSGRPMCAGVGSEVLSMMIAKLWVAWMVRYWS